MSNQQVNKVIIESIKALQQVMPGTLEAIAKEKCFITSVKEELMTENGPLIYNTVYIDFTCPIIYDYESFKRKSFELYNEFKNMSVWYKV